VTFLADYPGAIVVQARNYGYVVGGKHLLNNPKAWALHTPEEPPDNVPSTPYYFASTDRDASTTYFVSYLGFVFQMVPESEGAYGNAVEGKPYPAWADSTVNLNLQTLSVEIEGYAATIHQTMPRGSAQWRALVNLMAHRCRALNIPPGRTFGHYAVSVYRSDPGQLNIPLLVSDVIAALQPAPEEEEMTPEERAEFNALKDRVDAIVNSGGALTLQQIQDNIVLNPEGHITVTPWLVNEIAKRLPAASGYTDAQAVKAVKDWLNR